MKDTLIRGMAFEGHVRVFVARTTDLVYRAQVMHQTYPAATAALGRTLGIASIMGTTLKDDDGKLILEIRGEGPLGLLRVEADSKGLVRGFVDNPQAHQVNEATGKLDVGGIIGYGSLRVTQKTGEASFSSEVELRTGEIGDDFSYYFVQSEQIPSAVSVGVLVGEDAKVISAGAMLIQVLPNAPESVIDQLEQVIADMLPISALMETMSAEDAAKYIFPDLEILTEQDIAYFCGCNRTQMHRVLESLQSEDIQEMIDEDHGATLKCHYCTTEYVFSEADLKEILLNRQKN